MKYALIVAAGSGSRMKSAIPKQFMLLKGKPLICHTLQRFVAYDPGMRLILVIPKGFVLNPAEWAPYFDVLPDLVLVEGGETRFHSVQNGLGAITDDGIVFIHDGVRPFITNALLERCHAVALEKGNAIPCIELKDSLRQVMDGDNRQVPRAQYRSIQTPQTFRVKDIQDAYRQAYSPDFTDEASVMEQAGHAIHLVDGLDNNIKITSPADFLLAQCLLERDQLPG